MTYHSELLAKAEEHINCVAEEITLFLGLKTTVNNRRIEVDTVAGKMQYTCSERTVMGDVYRFINHYGGKLSRYGLENKIKESFKPIHP